MVRLLIIVVLGFSVFVALRFILAKKKLTVKQFSSIYLMTIFGLILLFLGVTGRLHPLFALGGAIIPFVLRYAPLFLRGLQLASVFRSLRNATRNTASPPPKTSEISSRYIHMTLFHDTGVMEGTVLEGQFKNRDLSQLEINQLKELLKEVEDDADSMNLLTAYLDREHGEWQSKADRATSSPPYNNEMSEPQALEILGLNNEATKEDVIQAHRRMMQRVHPDRGGSTYLATKINAAKDLLTKIRS